MLCPKCHNDNPLENETCDFCMATLPMTKNRQAQIEANRKSKQKAKFQKSRDKIIGMLLGISFIVALVLIGIFLFRG